MTDAHEGVACEASQPSVPKGLLLAFLVALSATLLMAGPVLQAPSERLFGSGTLGREDPNRDALLVIEQFRTGTVAPPYLQPLTDIPGRVLARLMSPVAAYNLLMLATFPLSAAAAYLLARYLLGSHLGAMVAGLAFAFLPFHVAHATGHLHVAQTQWLPLYFLALWRCLERPGLWRILLLIASAAAVVLSNFYAGLIAAALSPVALVAYALAAPRRRDAGRWRRLTVTGVALGSMAAAGLVLTQRLAPAVFHHSGAFAFPRSDLFLYSAKWWSYLLPTADHPLVGPWIQEIWAGRGLRAGLLEQQIGLGWGMLLLGVVPFWLWLRGDRASLAVRIAPVLAIVACAALLFSLSPERRIGFVTFVRPSALLYEIAPMFRAYARFAVAVGLMSALLAGAGVASLWRLPGVRGRLAAALLLALAALEYAPLPPWRWRDVLPTRAHRWLAQQPGSLRVLDCVPPSRTSDSLARSLLTHEVTLLGEATFDDCAEPGLGDKLNATGYTHVVVRRDSATGRWLAARPTPDGLARGPAFDDAWILEVRPSEPRLFVSALRSFYPREYDAQASWRWMGRTASLKITAARGPTNAVLDLELKPFPHARRVEATLNETRIGALEVAAEWHRYELPLGPLPAGESTLTLACLEPAIVANDFLRNNDPRPLALAVGDWRFADGGAER